MVNRKGVEVFTGKTPTVARLKAGAGCFKMGIYTITFGKDGHEKTTYTLKGEYQWMVFWKFPHWRSLGNVNHRSSYRSDVPAADKGDTEVKRRGNISCGTDHQNIG